MKPPAAVALDEGRYHSGIPALTDKEFSLFQSLVYKEAGIFLNVSKKSLIVGRLAKRLRELGLKRFEDYYHKIQESGPEEVQILLNLISTNETHFFREPHHFDLLWQVIFPEWKASGETGGRSKKIRVWSAACSTGEEPYSLAMILLDYFPFASGWEIEIVATDISTRVLDQARQGIWALDKKREIPEKYLKAFMLRGTGTQEGKIKADPEIRSLIHFSRMNLNESNYPIVGSFDMVFCRNVLIYFDQDSKTAVTGRMLNRLSPGGYLFLGHAESLVFGDNKKVKTVIPTVYQYKPV